MNSKNIFPKDLNNVHLHFVGIKGTGMVALVEICVSRGAIITGSDVAERFYTDEILENLNIKPTLFSSDNVTQDIDIVIYSAAYKLDENVELIQATKLNIPCILYSDALGEISSLAYSCGIAGVHGKTTTTGLVGTIIKGLNLPAQVLAGSAIKSFGNCTLSIGHKYFVAETCEYQRHFMAFHPQNIILTSVESDHQDYYPTFEDIQNAFVDYGCLLPKNGNLIYCADDKGATETAKIIKSKRDDINLIPYGFSAQGNYKILYKMIPIGSVKQVFELGLHPGFKFELTVPGDHNVLNSAAAIALTQILLCNHYEKKDFSEFSAEEQTRFLEATKKALESFTGSKRRSEIVSSFKNKNGLECVVIDDYGHHPTAINTTINGIKSFYKNKYIIVDFMSHTYSRTAALLDEFASSFKWADEVILHKIYSSARENPAEFPNISGKILFKKTKSFNEGKTVSYFEEVLEATDYVTELMNKPLPECYDGYVLVTMGAGDNWKLGRAVTDRFTNN
ncbi:MAG: UDP-N-acetylmuramate--L-alanine ligase [Treponemataceae bacterium]|nr:UDP-N-acetylmuramate--L-alanine ligase [Spirochaetales bacterium]MDY6031572.1 UDP-N-acetylmuramate--L-alanine ligase [Treponemataceae bacterium]